MAVINLVKGQKIDLTKGNTGLTKVIAGLGWDPVQSKGFLASRSNPILIVTLLPFCWMPTEN